MKVAVSSYDFWDWLFALALQNYNDSRNREIPDFDEITGLPEAKLPHENYPILIISPSAVSL
ncbi:MAG: hypothetical protein K2I56_09580 [Muribaculaceae bacterium]|nr:hypothetical protein [Muribaculaceae bacterium]